MEELKSNSITMATQKTSIINAIKTLSSHKKRPDELTILEFVKKDLQTTITNNDINENLARLTEIGKIKNNPSNNRNSYYLIDDSTNIADSQAPILTNTPQRQIQGGEGESEGGVFFNSFFLQSL